MLYCYLLASSVQVLFFSLSLSYWLISLSPQVYEKCTLIMLISQMRKQSPRKVKANLHPKLTLYHPALTTYTNLRVDHPAWFFFPTRLKLPNDLHHT